MTGHRKSFGKPSKTEKAKGEASSSRTEYNPWPCDEGQRFTLPDVRLPVISDDNWDQSNSYYYNNWLEISVEPTRFLCGTTLKRLGLLHDVTSILSASQFTDLPLQPDLLYPDLFHQCLASTKLIYTHPNKPIALEGVFSFFAEGKKYEISIPELYDLYGFDSGEEKVAFPNRFTIANALWDSIALGNYFSCSASQSTIRNPALRITAMAISTIFFCKDDASKVRTDELILLYIVVRDTIATEKGMNCGDDLDVNLGAVFAEQVANKRKKVAKGKGAQGTERIGNLLTRLFIHLGINLSTTTSNVDKEFLDTNFLITCEILYDESTYRFTSKDKRQLFYRLTQPTLTDLGYAANVGFNPGTEYLCSATGTTNRNTIGQRSL